MKAKITVELDEGVKEIVNVNFSTESVIIQAENHNKPFALRELMISAASDAVKKAMYKLYNKVASCRVVEFTLDGSREVVALEDVEYLPEDSKKAALKAIDERVVAWHNDQVKNIKKLRSIKDAN